MGEKEKAKVKPEDLKKKIKGERDFKEQLRVLMFKDGVCYSNTD